MQAIAAVGGNLCAAVDPSDSVGVIDSYFPDAHFFTEFERFDRYVDKVRREGRPLDYISICSPNHLHDAHVRFALRSGIDAICEKPLVLNPHNVEGLHTLENETGQRINTILQLRLHPAIINLRDKLLAEPSGERHDVDLTYITPRGRWYHVSWKGDEAHSGGIATNIGVHFFDMLSFLFGEVRESHVHHRSADRAAGYLEYDRARVRWFLSINEKDVPPHSVASGQKTFRSITLDGDEIEFSGGFSDLHTRSYEEILAGRGFSLAEVMPSIETVSAIRKADLASSGERHPYLARIAG
jgi:UDP-N-acetyl-2-amino-2-deoxyglucuronate dehydrogenase